MNVLKHALCMYGIAACHTDKSKIMRITSPFQTPLSHSAPSVNTIFSIVFGKDEVPGGIFVEKNVRVHLNWKR